LGERLGEGVNAKTASCITPSPGLSPQGGEEHELCLCRERDTPWRVFVDHTDYERHGVARSPQRPLTSTSCFIFLSPLGERLGEGVNAKTASCITPSPSLSPKGERSMSFIFAGGAPLCGASLSIP